VHLRVGEQLGEPGGEAAAVVRTTGTRGTSWSMPKASAAPVEFGHQYQSREARDRLSQLFDEAERGGVPVVRRARQRDYVVVRRDVLDDALAPHAPFEVQASVHDGQVSLWLDDVPVHAAAGSFEEAEAAFLDAVVDYAESWLDELRHAPNHQQHAPLVRRIAMYAGDRDELRRVVFGA
jgi:hypothetical protein